MSDLTGVFDAEFYERLRTLAEGPDEYVDVMDYSLDLTVRDLGSGERKEISLDLTGVEVNVAYNARVIEIVNGSAHLFIEADHRGPEHGVDAWIGQDSTPEALIETADLNGVCVDD